MPLITDLNQMAPEREVGVAWADPRGLEKLPILANPREGRARGVKAIVIVA
jgi:hypothetical protein